MRLAVGRIGQSAPCRAPRPRAGSISGSGHAVHLQTVGDVAAHGHVREQRVRLEHHVQRAPVGRASARGRRRPAGCVPASGSRSRRACAAAWSCRSRRARAVRRTRSRRISARRRRPPARSPKRLFPRSSSNAFAISCAPGRSCREPPWLRRCETNSSDETEQPMTSVATALISGVTPKRIIE